jgi:hypothetical protein
MSTPFIGALISLVSKAEVRYEGTLFSIDPGKATVCLQNGNFFFFFFFFFFFSFVVCFVCCLVVCNKKRKPLTSSLREGCFLSRDLGFAKLDVVVVVTASGKLHMAAHSSCSILPA